MMNEREARMNMNANVKVNLSTGRIWTARAMRWLVILFMAMDGIGKIAAPGSVVKSTLELGFSERHLAVMGILGLLSTLLYAIPRTTFLGALLLTGYMGGAVAAQLRVDAPLLSNELFPVYMAVIAWGAIWLTDARVRNLLTSRARAATGNGRKEIGISG